MLSSLPVHFIFQAISCCYSMWLYLLLSFSSSFPATVPPLLCAQSACRCRMNDKRGQGRTGGGSQARECHAGCWASWWDASALCRCGKLCGVLLLTVHLLQSPGLSAAPLPAVTALRVKSSPFLLKMSCKYHHTGLVIPSATSPLGHCTLLHLNL